RPGRSTLGVQVDTATASLATVATGSTSATLVRRDLPSETKPFRVRLHLAERHLPFVIASEIYGGGGFLAVDLCPDGVEPARGGSGVQCLRGFRAGTRQ